MKPLAREIPLTAFDHITGLLLQAGSAGAVSRAQADALVDHLRKEGRGTEALAADNLFRMVDHVDHEKRDHLTAAHFQRARAYYARRLLARNGPLEPSEIQRFSPTLRALLEIGQVMSIDSEHESIPHRVPQQGLGYIAKLLNRIADPDGRVTRADRDLAVYELYERGRGTEALALRYFFNFIEHRVPSGEDVTLAQVDDAVEYSDLKLLRQKDADQDEGYSPEEVATFSTTAKAFLRVGQMIEAGLISYKP